MTAFRVRSLPSLHLQSAADAPVLRLRFMSGIQGPQGEPGPPGADGTAGEWADIANKPTTFPPGTHTHDISDVDDLQTELDGKVSTDDDDWRLIEANYDPSIMRWIPDTGTLRADIVAGTNTTDLYTYLQNAIDQATRLKMPKGRFRTTAPLIFTRGIRLEGAGPQKSVFEISGTGAGLVFNPTDYTVARWLDLEGFSVERVNGSGDTDAALTFDLTTVSDFMANVRVSRIETGAGFVYGLYGDVTTRANASTTFSAGNGNLSGGQTVFPFTYSPGYLSITKNGTAIPADDFTAINGTSFTLDSAVAGGDVLVATYLGDYDGVFVTTIEQFYFYGGITFTKLGDSCIIKDGQTTGPGWGLNITAAEGAAKLIFDNINITNHKGIQIANGVQFNLSQLQTEISGLSASDAVLVINNVDNVDVQSCNLSAAFATIPCDGIKLSGTTTNVKVHNQCVVNVAAGKKHIVTTDTASFNHIPASDNTWITAGATNPIPSVTIGASARPQLGIATPLPLSNSWVAYSGTDTLVATMTGDGEVILAGAIKSGTMTAGTVMATLPAGMRPQIQHYFLALNPTNGSTHFVSVNADGTIKAEAVTFNTMLRFDGIRVFCGAVSA